MMGQPRRIAVRSLFTAIISALVLATSAYAQSGAASNKDEIDAFLSDLERTSSSPPATAAPASREPAASVPAATANVNSGVAPMARMEVRPLLPEEDSSGPLRTLLLMIGGVAICALATIGLTLAFFALRKDIQRKKRGRRRRFGSLAPDGAEHPPNRSN